MQSFIPFATCTLILLSGFAPTRGDDFRQQIDQALEDAGKNRGQIEAALSKAAPERQKAMRFLIANMPETDLKTLSSEFLLENVRYAFRAWREAPWRDAVPESVFLNEILPYASINEKRDDWRKDFFERFRPLVKDAKSPGEAAAILNNNIYPLLKVEYSTKRRRADQGPYESIQSGLASCTGLSILLIDACRAVGVPARFAGTPLWSDGSGNHSWVEIWDDGWHFTGAAEPTGDELDKTWFLGRASTADRAHRLHAIYAVSFKRTPQRFPMVWARNLDYIHAVNVTDRYTHAAKELPMGWARIMFEAVQSQGNRCSADLKIRNSAGQVVFEGKTNDERFDRNDHVTAELKLGEQYRVEFGANGRSVVKSIKAAKDGQVISVRLQTKTPQK